MAFDILKIDDKVSFRVHGEVNTSGGTKQKFDFTLKAQRLRVDELQKRLDQGETVPEFLKSIVEDWSGVYSGSDPLQFSAENLERLCDVPGMASLIFTTYLQEVGAKAKNSP